jgi:hypothetical protein
LERRVDIILLRTPIWKIDYFRISADKTFSAIYEQNRWRRCRESIWLYPPRFKLWCTFSNLLVRDWNGHTHACVGGYMHGCFVVQNGRQINAVLHIRLMLTYSRSKCFRILWHFCFDFVWSLCTAKNRYIDILKVCKIGVSILMDKVIFHVI